MRNFDRNSGYKNNNAASNYSRSREDRYYNDEKYRNSSNKYYKKRDYEEPSPRHSYQERRAGNDRPYRPYDRSSSLHDNKSYRSDRTFRNSPPKRSRDHGNSGGYRSNEGRRNMSPPSNRRNDYKPTGIKNRLAPLRSRIVNSNTSRIGRAGGNKILRRSDLRGGLVSKRSATINRAKDYARKIRQARMKLNEGSSSTSSRLKSTIEAKSPKGESAESHRKNDDNEDDYLAIANDVNFDEFEVDSTGGKNSSVKEEMKMKEEKEKDASPQKENKLMDEGSNDDKDEKKSTRTTSRTPSKERARKFDRIEYCCIHCGKQSTSAQEYRSHLSGRRHLLAMREVGLRVRNTLIRLRKLQRDKQLDIEARIKDVETIQSKYCQVCKLNFRQSKEEHRESDDHKKISSFLKPYCKICRMKLISPMKYEIHRCHTDHIRRKLKAQEGSDDDEIDMQEMNIGDFKTVDSIGSVDDEINGINDAEIQDELEDIVGMDNIEKIEAFYCSLCHDFIYNHHYKNDASVEEKLMKEHCKTRRHKSRFNDHKKDEERAAAKSKSLNEKTKQKSPEKLNSSKQNGSDEKLENNEIDRDADVNIDENTDDS